MNCSICSDAVKRVFPVASARPALDRLRDDARNKQFDAVLINDVDRLARDVTHLGIIKRDLERSGVRVVFRKIPSDNSPTHNLLINMLGSFAEFEREMILDRTRRGRLHKVETRQQFIGALAPFGYRYIRGTPQNPTGKLVINPEEAITVKRMFEWVDIEGLSAQGVTLRLTREGIKPRKSGNTWQKSSVLRILRGTVYTGTWHYNKHELSFRRGLQLSGIEPHGKKTSLRVRPKSEWIPVELPVELKIISKEQWERVQQQIDRNRAFSPRNSKHQYLLSGLVRCGGCKKSFCGNPSHGRFEYRCIGRCKRVPLITETTLDNSVWSALKRALDNPKLLKEAIEGMERQSIQSDDLNIGIQTALDGIKSEEARVIEAYRLKILSPEQLNHELELLSARREVLERQQIQRPQTNLPSSAIEMSVDEFCSEVRSRLTNLTFETKREVLRLLVKEVVFAGNQVTICGVLPSPEGTGQIADTGAQPNGHNPASGGGIAPTTVAYCARNPAPLITFTLVAPIVRDLTAKLAASRRNLIKASAMRWFGDSWRRARRDRSVQSR